MWIFFSSLCFVSMNFLCFLLFVDFLTKLWINLSNSMWVFRVSIIYDFFVSVREADWVDFNCEFDIIWLWFLVILGVIERCVIFYTVVFTFVNNTLGFYISVVLCVIEVFVTFILRSMCVTEVWVFLGLIFCCELNRLFGNIDDNWCFINVYLTLWYFLHMIQAEVAPCQTLGCGFSSIKLLIT